MARTKRKPDFTIEAMRGVVEHFRRRRLQPFDCPNCLYILHKDMDDSSICPEHYEEMRREAAYIQQCPDHNVPQYMWLHAVPLDKAAGWLLRRVKKSKYWLTMDEIHDEWKAAVYDAKAS